MSEAERRSTPDKPTIRKKDDGTQCCEGYAAVFYDPADYGTCYRLFDDLEEHIDPAAFNRALAEKQACRCFVNHDPNYRIGRADKGTLRVRCDNRGLHYESDIPDTQVGRDTAMDLANGNLDGSSFSFKVTGQRWEDKRQADGSILTIRTITDCDLYDVGPVAMPAYEGTTAGLRSAETDEDVRRQRDEWRKKESERVETRARFISIASRAN